MTPTWQSADGSVTLCMDEYLVAAWNNCYDDGWQGHIVDEAFAHPAKFSYGLIVRIVKHMLAQGWIEPGQVVGDPFGGIGTGGIVCAANGLRWIGCELEPRFVELARKNFALNPWCRNGACTILQGDSRNFASLIGQCQSVVTSPPYESTPLSGGGGIANEMRSTYNKDSNYGSSPGQLASLPVGDLAAIISSPPFGEDRASMEGQARQATFERTRQNHEPAFGITPGQLGAMKEGRLDSVVTSPPREKGVATADPNWLTPGEQSKRVPSKSNSADYGSGNGQLGNTSGDTYWTAVAEIYRQCLIALKPGGYIAVVVKSYVKAGKIVPLPDQTWTLLQHVGFEPVERVRAMLVKEDSHPGLFDGPVVKKTERKSFFRRLAERKGSPAIDFEEILFLRKGELELVGVG